MSYHELRKSTFKNGEMNDCTVISLAVSCKIPYDEAHAILKKHGRKDRRGASFWITQAAYEELGYELKPVKASEFIEKYPRAHQKLQTVTPNQVEKFPMAWRDGKIYVMRVHKHILTIDNGEVMDWTKGRAHRAHSIYEVIKK